MVLVYLGHCLGGVEESGAGNTMMSLNNVGKTPQGEATVGTRPEDIRMT